MPHYVQKQFQWYGYKTTTKKQESSFPAPPICYGKSAQTVIEPNPSPVLTAKEQKIVQQVTGSFIYYARTVDPTILMGLNSIAGQQENPTEQTLKQLNYFLQYMATHPNANI